MAGIPRPRTPIDETLWRDTTWYRHFGPITHATVMQYFHQSPFFDPTSNNGVIMGQMEGNMQLRASITSQDAFDAQLRKMQGIEFTPSAGSQENCVWVIRKQNRRSPTNTIILATYYISGENVYQAPSVGAVLHNRLLTITNELRKCLEAASSVSFQSSAASAGGGGQAAATTQSGASQPLPSTQSSVDSVVQPAHMTENQTKARKDARMMQHAFSLSLKHQNEFMDDHAPLLGDPGSLLNTSMTSQLSGTSSSLQVSQTRGGTVTPTPGQDRKGAVRIGTPGSESKKGPGLVGNRKSVVGVGVSMKK